MLWTDRFSKSDNNFTHILIYLSLMENATGLIGFKVQIIECAVSGTIVVLLFDNCYVSEWKQQVSSSEIRLIPLWV